MVKSVVYCNDTCRVCDKPLAIEVASFPFNDQRRPGYTPLLCCIGCGSAFFNHEPRSGSSLAWHQRVYERNLDWSRILHEKLKKHRQFSRVIDIGCGIGTWLSYLHCCGVDCLGFDTASHCISYGASRFGLQLRDQYFTAEHLEAGQFAADLVTCIMVMEHLSAPRELASQMSSYCKTHGAWLFVSVPFFNHKEHIYFDSDSQSHNVFNDVGAHVTYFTDVGMRDMFQGMGMKFSALISGVAWRGLLFRPFEAPANIAGAESMPT